MHHEINDFLVRPKPTASGRAILEGSAVPVCPEGKSPELGFGIAIGVGIGIGRWRKACDTDGDPNPMPIPKLRPTGPLCGASQSHGFEPW